MPLRNHDEDWWRRATPTSAYAELSHAELAERRRGRARRSRRTFGLVAAEAAELRDEILALEPSNDVDTMWMRQRLWATLVFLDLSLQRRPLRLHPAVAAASTALIPGIIRDLTLDERDSLGGKDLTKRVIRFMAEFVNEVELRRGPNAVAPGVATGMIPPSDL